MCYQCSKCNQCGRFSYKVAVLCRTCNQEIPPGVLACPNCGNPTADNTYTGNMVHDAKAPVRDKSTKALLDLIKERQRSELSSPTQSAYHDNLKST